MIKSMTGYGRAETLHEGKKWVVEIRSLNHRYMEIIVRLPGALTPLEMEIKKKVGEKLVRGRVDVTVQMDAAGSSGGAMQYELDLPLLRNYLELLNRIRTELKLKEKADLNTVSRFRDIFVPSERKLDAAQAWVILKDVLDKALRDLVRMREKEGAVIRKDFLSRIGKIQKYLEATKSRIPEVVSEYQKRLSERVKELSGGLELDGMRLAQEVALLAEKTDITEEIVRLESHIEQLTKLLDSRDSAGRKIDFLLQEMCREVNTMGSKSSDVMLSHQVIELKSEITKLREQVQNVE
ncbi:MAG TPA: YicC family protein [Syntrophales bacterium]|nr:YicC family protein [Syntrophales bacterium]HOX94134.1 YicC family protein [Syntrophales bacterium]HPI57362.1 YicC family protein [Syntrophales bacterium]HPN25426.1 YicC family protein [Syntrophales bacterium]HQM29908.1 YicC family protein [Syntrophales bacterium]